MTRRFDHPPTLDEIEAIARAALAGLPEPFAAHLARRRAAGRGSADEDLLAELGIEHPLDLTGVYEGIPIGERSVDACRARCPTASACSAARSSTNGSRRARALEHLVRHILIHEVGHHFGLSDEDMHALEEQA